MRAALLAPVDRNEHYSASPAWSRALVSEVLPALQGWPRPRPAAGPGRDGSQPGGLAVLAAASTAPASFGGLFLQSGSFFRPVVDDHERGFPRFRRITRFVDDLAAGDRPREPAAAALTCGTVEENLPATGSCATPWPPAAGRSPWPSTATRTTGWPGAIPLIPGWRTAPDCGA
jgi:enterochelin esterase family protein